MMKRFFACLLILLLCMPVLSLADVLAPGWEEADLQELQEANQLISNKISELRAAAASDVTRVELSGNGTGIISEVNIPFAPSRIILTSDGDCTAKLTDGQFDHAFDGKGYEETFFSYTGTYTLLVETSGAWSFTVEPIMDGGTLPMSGVGPFVSDFIELPAPMIVTVTGDAAQMDAILTNFIIKSNHQYANIDSWQGEALTNELLTAQNEPFSADVILQPVKGRTQYCISVTCEPGVKWSITPKN